MGSFYSSCLLSNLTVFDGDEIMAIPLARNEGRDSWTCYPTDLYQPIGFPMSGVYDDYGRIAPHSDDAGFEQFEKFIIRHTNYKNFDEFYDSAWQDEAQGQNNAVTGEPSLKTFSLAFMHKKAYEEMIRHFRPEETDGIMDFLEQAFQLAGKYAGVVLAVLINHGGNDHKFVAITIDNRLKEHFGSKTEIPPKLLAHLRDYAKKHPKTGSTLNPLRLLDLSMKDFGNVSFIMDTYEEALKKMNKQKDFAPIRAFVQQIMDLQAVYRGMMQLNKSYVPQRTSGQQDNRGLELLWQAKMLKLASEKAHDTTSQDMFGGGEDAEQQEAMKAARVIQEGLLLKGGRVLKPQLKSKAKQI